MKAVILAGGTPSTINNEREGIPKPMVEIGGRPMLWHIMKHFSLYGINEFIICGGYRVDLIKEYFTDFYIYESDITVDLEKNIIQIHKKVTEPWKVTVVDTGLDTMTGKRVSLIEKYIDEDTFIVTYGDCLSDIDVSQLLETHKRGHKCGTVTIAKPKGRNQILPIDENGSISYGKVMEDQNSDAWVNADCFVFSRDIFNYLQKDEDLEKQLLVSLAEDDQITTYCHKGYWRSIETRRDLVAAEKLWNTKSAPWIK